jgi:putative thiamine transport system ATP-binding protein
VSEQGLKLSAVEIHQQSRRLLAIDATIRPGEILSLMGPSGSGKSTLISAIAGFLSPHFTCRGHITLDGTDITALPPEARHVGVLFQDPLLFPHFSVIQNVIFALPRGGTASERHARALDLLDGVGMADCARRDPATLSGGQAARVALMRVVAANPRALLLDEPFSKLDMALRDAVRELVFDLVRERRLPALLVTHDRADANAAAGTIATL